MHVIRLRGPWDYEPLARYHIDRDDGRPLHRAPLPAGGRLQLPADWRAACGADFFGCVVFRRHFNGPTGIEPGDRLWLAFTELPAGAIVRLNGEVLHACSLETPLSSPAIRCEVATRLSSRNLLEVEVEFTANSPHADTGEQAELWIEVWLEIESAK